MSVRNDENVEDNHGHSFVDRGLIKYLTKLWQATPTQPIWQSMHGAIIHTESTYLSASDVMSALLRLHPKVSAKYNLVVTATEDFKDGQDEHKFVIFKWREHKFAIRSKYATDEHGFSDFSCCIYGVHDNGSNVGFDTVVKVLDSISKENFVATVDPTRNFIELGGDGLAVVPRVVHKPVVYNLDIDRISASIKHALASKQRRVVALIGDPGLGKTESVHAIINRFPDVPAFFVTSSAVGRDPEPRVIRSIFRAASVTQAILVIDDFDGFNVKDKSACVTEFLRQFGGAADFQGIALLTINDPQNVAHTILDRPGRVDEVWCVGYLDTLEVVSRLMFDARGIDNTDGEYNSVYQTMIENRFSTSRLVGAVDYAKSFGDVTPESLGVATKYMLEFHKNANMVSKRGRIERGPGAIDSAADVEPEPDLSDSSPEDPTRPPAMPVAAPRNTWA